MNTCKKTVLCVLAVLLSCLLMSFTCAASENIGDPANLYLNNTVIDGAFLLNDTTYASFRALVTAIDPEAQFIWDASSNSAKSYGTGVEISAVVGQNYISANGRILYNDRAANVNVKGSLYVPVTSIAKAYSLKCTWNGKTTSANISGTPAPILSGALYYDEDSLYWLSRIISAESRGEPFRGQIAVGNVVIERVGDGSFPDTVYEVIFDRKYGTQFSPAYSGTIYKNPADSSVLAAKIALEGTQVVDALYFCPVKGAKGSWMDRNRTYIDTIGNHVFYW